MFDYDSDCARFLNKWVPRFLWVTFIVGFVFGILTLPSDAENYFFIIFHALFFGFGFWLIVGLLFVPIQMHYWALSEMRSNNTVLGKMFTYILAFAVMIFLFIIGFLPLGSEY
jgi:hypothetical protein